MGKIRRWQAYITVSASGPEASTRFADHGYTCLPRMAGDLRYTTADAAFLSDHWRRERWHAGRKELHTNQLGHPPRSALVSLFLKVADWLGSHSKHPEWDGGFLSFAFAGHGREGDGALVLSDGVVTPEELHGLLVSTSAQWSHIPPLRVAVTLDSCHSGEFALRLFEDLQTEPRFSIDFMHAACAPDEFAWEDTGLGHGLFTYSFSVRTPPNHPPFGIAARAVQPDNTLGPSLELAGGQSGCSLLAFGRQNPMSILDLGIRSCGTVVPLVHDDRDALSPTRSLREVRTDVFRARDVFVDRIRSLSPERRYAGPSRWTDDDMRSELVKMRSSRPPAR